MLWILLLSASSRCALKRKCFCLVTWTHRSRGKQSTRDFRRTTLNYIGDFQTSFVYPCLSYRLLTEFNPPKRPCKRVARSTSPFPFPTPSQTTAAVVTSAMTSICCPHCRSVQRLSFWELHARLGQPGISGWEVEAPHFFGGNVFNGRCDFLSIRWYLNVLWCVMSYFLRELLICWIHLESQSVRVWAGNLCGKTNLARHLHTFLFISVDLGWTLARCYEMESAIGGRKVGRSDSEARHFYIPEVCRNLPPLAVFASINHDDQSKENRKATSLTIKIGIFWPFFWIYPPGNQHDVRKPSIFKTRYDSSFHGCFSINSGVKNSCWPFCLV